MKVLAAILISAGVILSLSFSSFAQGTEEAVMRVSVRVVSGATAQQPSLVNMQLKPGVVSFDQIEPAKITAYPNTDVQISSSENIELVNEYEEVLAVSTSSGIKQNTSKSNCSTSFGAILNCPPNLRGTYRGNYNTRVEYF